MKWNDGFQKIELVILGSGDFRDLTSRGLPPVLFKKLSHEISESPNHQISLGGVFL
jgi:hypothetical protein